MKIEDGVPIPAEDGPGRHNPGTADIYEAAGTLEPGQSFVVDAARFHRGMPSNFAQKFGGAFSYRWYTRGPDLGKVRIWRRA